VDAFGVDLSPEMIALARRTYPHLRFEVGSMLALDTPDASLGGVVANYSIIYVPWAGLSISLDWYLQQPDEVAELLGMAGFEVRVRVVREPEPDVEKVRPAARPARPGQAVDPTPGQAPGPLCPIASAAAP
jgi:hypothetical protein